MKGHDAVIEVLNETLTAELTAVNQYFLDAKMLSNWGYQGLGGQFRHESIDEMKDADELIDRILFLEGVPNLQRLDPLRIGETPLEKLQAALELEVEAIERLNRGIALCVTHGDGGSRELLEKILVGEENHATWLQSQLHAIGEIGVANYLAHQLS
ncbi:MAG: bacterioferritin [Acidimicrobiia bacterium]